MDYANFLTTLDWGSVGFVALATFGAVAAVNFWRPQNKQVNFLMSVVFAVVFGLIPADLGSIILNKVRDGISVALLVNGLYQGASNVAMKAAGTKQ